MYHDSKYAEPVIFGTKELTDEFIQDTVAQEEDDEFFIVREGVNENENGNNDS